MQADSCIGHAVRPVRLTLVRHGQTPCSVAEVYCGRQCDPGLTDSGHAMAEALAQALAPQHWDGLYSSPQRRAQQTLAPLVQHTGLPAQVVQGLSELDYGAWDGQTQAMLRHTDAASLHAWHADPARSAPPGGESVVALWQRGYTALMGIVEDHAAKATTATPNILLMAHKSTLRVLMCGLLGMDIKHYRQRFAWPLAAWAVVELTPLGPCIHTLGCLP